MRLAILLVVFMMSVHSFASPSVVVKVSLFPAGSFDAETKQVIGKGIKSGNKYMAKELKVPVNSLETGIKLRDKHLKEKLKAKEYPHIIVRDVVAEKNKGKAKITVMNITKDIEFEYKDIGNDLAKATFTLNLPDFKFEGISYKGVGVEDEVEVTAVIGYDKK